MTAIVVREFRPVEMPVLAALYGASFDEPYPEPVAASLLRTPGAWCHIAFDGTDGLPVGFAITRIILDEAELLSIGALPDARRRGMATALLDAGFVVARNAGARTMHLEVGEDNPGAATLYRKHGFRVTGRRPNYYRRADRRPVAALLMTVDLTDQNSG